MSQPSFNKSARGFSLVEIMVAMIVGLIGMIVVFQVFSVFEGQKRTATSGGDAQQNGTLALFAIEREARMAGYGINYLGLAGCNVVGYDAGPPVRDPLAFTLAAAKIGAGLPNAPDNVTFVYGNSSTLVGSLPLQSAAPAASNIFSAVTGYGFAVGDILIAGEVPAAGLPIVKNCTVSMITSMPVTNTLNHDPGNYTAGGVTQVARYNKPGGMGVDYAVWDNVNSTGGRLFDVGQNLTVVTYSLDTVNNQLRASYLMDGSSSSIADGIVQFKAQYGIDNTVGTPTGVVNQWTAIGPTTTTGWSRVLALKLVVVARSGQMERPTDPVTKQIITGPCNTTTAPPSSMLGPIDVSADPNWQCYRYRVFETVVPIRNQLWSPLL
jgi:type IV pilus assembly protein PilW